MYSTVLCTCIPLRDQPEVIHKLILFVYLLGDFEARHCVLWRRFTQEILLLYERHAAS